jgi:hypothetical protein
LGSFGRGGTGLQGRGLGGWSFHFWRAVVDGGGPGVGVAESNGRFLVHDDDVGKVPVPLSDTSNGAWAAVHGCIIQPQPPTSSRNTGTTTMIQYHIQTAPKASLRRQPCSTSPRLSLQWTSLLSNPQLTPKPVTNISALLPKQPSHGGARSWMWQISGNHR